jgi:hypothetical protein
MRKTTRPVTLPDGDQITAAPAAGSGILNGDGGVPMTSRSRPPDRAG